MLLQVHRVLSVGGRNGLREYLNVTYAPYALEKVNVPEDGLVLAGVWVRYTSTEAANKSKIL